jgi:hypothetical protein
MLPAHARSLVEMQFLDELEVMHEERQGRERNPLPFGFASPIRERLGQALEVRHGAAAFLAFREKIDHETPAHRDRRVILGNYAADETAAVPRWLASRNASRRHLAPGSNFSNGFSPNSRDSA